MKRLLLLGAFLLIAGPVWAQDPVVSDCTQYAQLPAYLNIMDQILPVQMLATDGEVFCMVTVAETGGEMRLVWGVSVAGAEPLILGEYFIAGGWPTALTVDGTLVAIGTASGILYDKHWLLVDFSKPDVPQELWQTVSAHEISDLEIAGNLIGLATLAGGFELYDISDPEAPIEIPAFTAADWAVSIAEDAGVWYAAGREGIVSFIRAYDLSAPIAPVLLGDYTSYASETDGNMFSGLAVDGATMAVRLAQYHPDQWGGTVTQYHLRILDVTNPATMVQVGQHNDALAAGSIPAVNNGMIYAPTFGAVEYVTEILGEWLVVHRVDAEQVPWVGAVGDRMLWANGYRLEEHEGHLQVPSPLVTSVPINASSAIDLEVTATHLFESRFLANDGSIGSYDSGYISVYDLSEPAHPVYVRSIYAQMGAPIGSFVVQGEYVHTEIGSFHWPTGQSATTHVQMYRDGCLAGDVLYAPEYRGFRVYDLALPDTPVAVGDYLDTISISTLVHNSGYLYAFGSELTIFDVSSPLAPELITTVPLPEYIYEGMVVSNYLYLAASGGLFIYDLAVPDQPTMLADLTLGGCRSVAVLGTTAYLAATSTGMFAINVIDPANPIRLGRYNTGADAMQVATGGEYVYSLDRDELAVLRQECQPPSAVDDRLLPAPGLSVAHLALPYPNPFNPRTELYFELDRAGEVTLTIHDTAGRRINTLVTGVHGEGGYSAFWNGRNTTGRQMSAGVYFARLRTPDGVMVRKLVMVK